MWTCLQTHPDHNNTTDSLHFSQMIIRSDGFIPFIFIFTFIIFTMGKQVRLQPRITWDRLTMQKWCVKCATSSWIQICCPSTFQIFSRINTHSTQNMSMFFWSSFCSGGLWFSSNLSALYSHQTRGIAFLFEEILLWLWHVQH